MGKPHTDVSRWGLCLDLLQIPSMLQAYTYSMIIFLLIILVCPLAHADIFKIDDQEPEITDEHIVSDAPSFKGYQDVALGSTLGQKFQLTSNLNKYIDEPFQNPGPLITSVKSSGLMGYQYSDPAAVDLLKFYTTI